MSDDQQARAKAIVAWKTFLESPPPNTPKVIADLADHTGTTVNGKEWKVARPRLKLHCSIDDGARGFGHTTSSTEVGDQFLTYRCRDCGQMLKTISVLISYKNRDQGVVEIMKLGEYPPFAAPISTRIGKLLGTSDLELYKKGPERRRRGWESEQRRTSGESWTTNGRCS